MTNTVSSTSGTTNRPRLCRSDNQPNMLEYIDTTLNDSFSSCLKLQVTPSTTTTTTTNTLLSNGYDQFGNTIVDQYLLYILCQKINPNRTDNRTKDLYQSLHKLFLLNGKISKSFFEYSPSSINRSSYQSLFNSYTNFIWNEFDIDILLELACFLLKYRLRDIFINVTNNKTNINSTKQKMIGYFLEIIGIYYICKNHHEFFIHSRSKDMLFPYPSSTLNFEDSQQEKDSNLFNKFLCKIYDNGEITFNLNQIKLLLRSDEYQFLNKKLENKKIGFMNFFETIIHYQQENSCRSLKSICRLSIKMHIKQFPDDIKQLSTSPLMNDRLITYLTYENNELPDIALIKIFRTLDHIELVRLYHSFHTSKRIQNLIHNSSCLWIHIHIKSTVDYHLFNYFSRLLISNALTIRQLIINELDLTCRKILYDNGFSLKKFSNLEQLIIHDEYICHTLQSLNFCSLTLKILRLTNNHINLHHINNLNQLNTLQLAFYSIDILHNKFEKLINLHLKIIFINEFDQYLHSCSHLHTLELSYLHGMCPLNLYTNINYLKYQRIILINICQLKQMKIFIEFNQIDLPLEYLQLNSTLNINQYSSYIQNEYWYRRQIISIDYIQCVTTSIELLNDLNIIWSDKNQITQSFESYILRSIYNVSHLISSLKNLSISKFELSLNGLITLMTNLPLLIDLIITDGKIDQMGSGMWNIEKIVKAIPNILQSNIQTIVMNNIQMSRRTVVQLCLMTQQLILLTMNDVRILDKMFISEQNQTDIHPSFLVLLKQIAQYTDQFKWNHMKSLTIGKNMINRQNLLSFIPSDMNNTYSININHLCIIIHDHTLLTSHDIFQKSIKKLIKLYSKLTSFIIEFTKRYDGHFRLRNQLQTLFELNTNKKVYVYPTIHDHACRFCFDTNFNDEEENYDNDEQINSSQYKRTFCGIPLFQFKKQRKLSVLP
ncbi:unnamed protein product [Rotaria sordida]|uniref:F-box domain-containing protein n=1 Tax=Rotaria sordida TaxID=392033 RepID=A0A814NB27_9BILA|nr:unnamed protein product [Rotaria sordida]